MSYDLMVFEPEAAPKDHAGFLIWYAALTKWKDGPYDDPAQTSARLRSWVQDMQRMFPNVDSQDEVIAGHDNDVLAEYSIGRQFVYTGFAWSKSIDAKNEACRLAKLHKVGLFEVSSSGEHVWLPAGGILELAHRKKLSLFDRLRSSLHIE